jgi:PIN domain nuclease of toxin-antitoxin system
LLDTCTLLWLSDPDAPLPARVSNLIQRTPAGYRYVSAITAFEIGVKCAKRRLSLPLSPQAWLDATYVERGIASLPVTDRIACRAAALPALHKDPADRIIVATAILHDLVVLTPDENIRAYPGVKTRW